MTFVLVETTESFFEHQMVMPTDVPVLTITEAASLFPNDCMVPLALTEAPASALGELSEDALLKLRMCAPRPARLQSAFNTGSITWGCTHARASHVVSATHFVFDRAVHTLAQ